MILMVVTLIDAICPMTLKNADAVLNDNNRGYLLGYLPTSLTDAVRSATASSSRQTA